MPASSFDQPHERCAVTIFPFVREPFTVIDGGLSTALELLGADISGPLWTAQTVIDDPALLERAHRSFVEAGADIIATASYQCGTKQFEAIGLTSKEARNALASMTSIARRAVEGTSVAVAASVGPFGASQANGNEYTGRYGVEWQVVEDYHREKLQILVDSGADLIAVETIPLADEALLIAEILEELGAPPAWFSFGFADETQTYGLDAVDKAVLGIAGYADLVAIGLNCTHPRYVNSLLASMSELVSGIPLIVYPNHGREWDAVGRCWTGDSISISSVETLQRWVDLGARFVGGCCGVDPLGIADLVTARDSISN
jgi:S-methylmethionine-dependent homocysteine/selenocysteine methylase